MLRTLTYYIYGLPLDLIFAILLEAFFMVGVLLIFWKDFAAAGEALSDYLKKATGKPKKKRESDFDREIRRLLESTVGERISVRQFKLGSILLGIAGFFVGYHYVSILLGAVFGAVMLVIPYIVLKYWLQRSRNKGSAEAESLLQNLLIQYRASNFNMNDALDRVVQYVDDIPVTSKMIFKLSMSARTAKTGDEIKDITDSFAYAIGTNWSKMLANNIYRALKDGVNVSDSIEDILSQLKNARFLTEERKRINAESGRLLYLIPVAYVGTVYMCKMMDTSPSTFLRTQFTTIQGILLFIVITAIFIISLLLVSLTKSKKFDF